MSVTVTRWWWIRHAPVTNTGGVIYGHMDVDCDCSNDAAFKNLAQWLPNDAILCTSDLKRTQETAAAIAAQGADLADPVIIPDFKEQSFGAWEGYRYDQLEEFKDGPNHRFWLAPAHERPPEGESFLDLVARVSPAITALSEQHAGKDIIAVTHGGTIRAALSFALGLDSEKALAFSIDNLSLTCLEHIEQDGHLSWRIVGINEKSTR